MFANTKDATVKICRMDLLVSVTAESNVLAVGTAANRADVTGWNQVNARLAAYAGQTWVAKALAGIDEFTLELTCDATETLTSPILYACRQTPLTNADDTFTATAASPSVVTASTHGLLTGDGPFRLSNSGGALPTGFLTDTDYYIEKIDANTFYLHLTLASAAKGTSAGRVAATGTGTGTHTISDKQTADGYLCTDDHTKRLHWCFVGNLNEGNTITVGAQLGYLERIRHDPANLFYEIGATSGTGAQTLVMRYIPAQTCGY